MNVIRHESPLDCDNHPPTQPFAVHNSAHSTNAKSLECFAYFKQGTAELWLLGNQNSGNSKQLKNSKDFECEGRKETFCHLWENKREEKSTNWQYVYLLLCCICTQYTYTRNNNFTEYFQVKCLSFYE